jgi:hypothetical protein
MHLPDLAECTPRPCGDHDVVGPPVRPPRVYHDGSLGCGLGGVHGRQYDSRAYTAEAFEQACKRLVVTARRRPDHASSSTSARYWPVTSKSLQEMAIGRPLL